MNKQIEDFFDGRAAEWDSVCVHDPLRVSALLALCGRVEGARVLDVGCGTGVLERFLLPMAPKDVLGIDLSQNMIALAQKKHAGTAARFERADVLELAEGPFDIVIVYSAFPHLLRRQAALEKLSALVAPGGRLLIAHSDGRETINSRHRGAPSPISLPLPPARELAASLPGGLAPVAVVDTPEMYAVCALKKPEA